MFLLTSCKKKIEPSWDVGVKAPLVYTILDFTDIVPDSNLVSSDNHELSLIYQESFYDFSLDSLVSFPDTISTNILPSLPGVTLHPGQLFYNLTESNSLKIPNAELSKANFRSGFLKFRAISTIAQNVIVTYKVPCAQKNGVPFEETFTIPPASVSQPLEFAKEFDISGYKLDLRGPNYLSSNIYTSTILAKIGNGGNDVVLTDFDQLNFFIRFDDLIFDYLKGNFGSHYYQIGPDTAQLKIFDKFTAGYFDLNDAKLSLDISNGFGVDARIVFNQLKSLNSSTGNLAIFNDPIIGQPINIARSMETLDPLHPVNPSVYHYDLNNNNAVQLLENQPNKICYQLNLLTNPMGNISLGNDYIYYDNYLKTLLTLEIPLHLNAHNLTIADTVLLDFGEYNDNPSSGILTILSDNWFPFTGNFQIYLINESNQITDSVFDNCTILPPSLNADNKVTAPRRTEISLPISIAKHQQLCNTKKAWVTVKFNTGYNGQLIKIYDYYNVKIKVTGAFDYLIN
jgi:hypothetical protein